MVDGGRGGRERERGVHDEQHPASVLGVERHWESADRGATNMARGNADVGERPPNPFCLLSPVYVSNTHHSCQAPCAEWLHHCPQTSVREKRGREMVSERMLERASHVREREDTSPPPLSHKPHWEGSMHTHPMLM